MPTLTQKVHYAEDSRVSRAYVTQVHSESCVDLRVFLRSGEELVRDHVNFSNAPAQNCYGVWTEAQIREWEQPGSMSGPLTSADFRRR